MTVRPLVLAGAGGFARETVELVNAINEREPAWDLLGFLDDDPSMQSGTVGGLPVLGPIDWIVDHDDVAVVVCVGSPANFVSRFHIVARLGLADDRYATLIHPAAVLAHSTVIGAGTVVGATTVTTCDVTLGAHVAVMPGVVLTHDDVVANYATLAAGVRVAGGVSIELGAYVGSGALVREGLTVGAWSLIGMGAVVTSSVPARQVWVGSPARHVRDVELPADLLIGGAW